MLVDSKSDGDHRGYWYNGKTITYYSYDENNYAVIKAPATIMETIEAINRDYGIYFPAADNFYFTFTDDLIANSEKIVSWGRRTSRGGTASTSWPSSRPWVFSCGSKTIPSICP